MPGSSAMRSTAPQASAHADVGQYLTLPLRRNFIEARCVAICNLTPRISSLISWRAWLTAQRIGNERAVNRSRHSTLGLSDSTERHARVTDWTDSLAQVMEQ